MAKQVRIVGDPEVYDVLCETESTKVLVNPAARKRRDVAQLEARIANLRDDLERMDAAADAHEAGQ